MKLSCIQLTDPAPPASGYRFAALASLAETYFPGAAAPLRAVLPAILLPGEDVHDRQHVTPEGTTTTNGVLWLERAAVQVSLDPAGQAPLLFLDAELDAGSPTTSPLQAEVHWQSPTAFSIAFEHPDGAQADFILDRYGRPALQQDRGVAALLQRDLQDLAPSPPPQDTAPVRIAVIADPQRMRLVYPAVLAALGDAADALACDLSIDIFSRLDGDLLGETGTGWRRYDGVVMPGGADMERTESLIAAAGACRQSAIPTLGLCLGMQAICVAAARQLPELQAATLSEIAPDAEQQLFIPLPANEGVPSARLGDRSISLPADCHLAGQLRDLGAPTAWQERMNHHHYLAPQYLSALTKSGLLALSQEGPNQVVDIVEDPGLPFFIGSEGHPELSSCRAAPHPLLLAFLDSARRVESNREAKALAVH